MKRVLVISYYFPPSGGPGVQRVLKFVKYLRAFGWEPVVLTVGEGAYPEEDPSLEEEIPAGLSVYRTASWDPFRWYARLTGKRAGEAVMVGSVKGAAPNWKERLARWIRANIFLPDARVGWVPFAVARGKKIIKELRIHALVTSGPPHSTHLVGRALHRRFEVPWIADFRDPWTDINYYAELPHTSVARWMDARLERSVLQKASMVTTVSSSCRVLLEEKIEGEAERFFVIHNGYDEADFEGITAAEDRDHFVISYIGSLYASRNPLALWQALEGLRAKGEVPRLRVRLVGKVDPVVADALRTHRLEDLTECIGYVPHQEAIRYMVGSAVLLLVIESFEHDAGVMTGKLYEYLAARRPVLGIGPVAGDAATLLRDVEAGRIFAHDDVEGIAAFIRTHYAEWVKGPSGLRADGKRVRSYSRRTQTGHLAGLLDRVHTPGYDE